MKIVCYYRVSTKRQGESGLGLEAQVAAVEAFATRRNGKIVGTFKEVESGRKSDRPQLAAALKHARRCGGTLVVAKLDRLSRDAAFLLALQNGRVPFVAVDNENANDLTVGLLAVIAQHEAKTISQRTKDALAAAKRRGVLLGSARPDHWKGREGRRIAGGAKARLASIKVRTEQARESREDLRSTIEELEQQGIKVVEMANELNARGLKTRTGCDWTFENVQRLRKALRAEASHARA